MPRRGKAKAQIIGHVQARRHKITLSDGLGTVWQPKETNFEFIVWLESGIIIDVS